MAGQQCPRCGYDDQAQSVRTVVSAGSSSGTFEGPTSGVGFSLGGGLAFMSADTTLSGKTQTELAKRLSPPARPYWRNVWTGFAPYLAVVACGIGGGLGIWLSVVGAPAACLLFTWGAFVLGAAGVALAVWVNRRRRAVVVAAMPGWSAALKLWEPLDYCHRCDVVYVPGSGHFETPEEMRRRLVGAFE
jgi:hypothetical protein